MTEQQQQLTPQETTAATAKRPVIRLGKRVMRLLAVVVLFGALLRLIGLGWSLPDNRHPYATYHPDERINLNAALQADVSHLKFDIGFYNYGAFYFYLANVSHIVGRAYGVIPPIPPNDSNTTPGLAKENAGLFFMGRLVTALMGIATIPVIFGIGRRLYSDNVGLFAALLYAIAPLAVVHAHFFTVDVPSTLFVALALLYAARLLEIVTIQDIVLAGVWTGLAAATKYNAVLVGIAPLAALFLSPSLSPPRPLSQTSLGRGGVRGYGVLLVSIIFTFLIACPGVWLNFDAFWNGIPNYPGSGVRYELFEHSREGHGELFIQTGIGAIYHLLISLPQGLGIPLLLLFLVGIGVSIRRRTSADKVLLAFFFLAYILYSLSAVRFARYMLPLFPVICVLAARAVVERKPNNSFGKITLALGITAGVVVAWMSVLCVGIMRSEDPRDVAADWLEENAKQGAVVAFGRTPWFTSPPLHKRFGLPAALQRAESANDTSRYTFRIPSAEWDKSVLEPAPDYVVFSNLETMHPLRLGNPAAVAFLDAAKKDRQAQIFTTGFPTAFFGTNTLISEDMLYILPTVTIYHK